VSRSKYGAVRTEVDGIKFASKAEARRYGELKLLEKAGEIRGLECQPEFPLMVLDIHGKPVSVGRYIADFRYRAGKNGLLTVEDVKCKATRTAVYRLKKRIVEAQHNFVITEVE